MHLAEALHNETGLATSPFMLASLYHCLQQITIDLLNLAVCGPIWMVHIWLEWYFPELGNEELEYLEDDVPATALATNPKRPVCIEECFIFFRDCKQRSRSTWLRLLFCDVPWFVERSLHEAPRHRRELTDFRSRLHPEMSASCLTSQDLFFGGGHSDKKCAYGVEAYNPQFVSRQFGIFQVVPELRYSSINKGSSWRHLTMTPQEIKAVSSSWKDMSSKVRVPPSDPTPLYTPAFHDFWENRLFSWLPETAKLLHVSAFQNCPFARTMTEQEEKSMRWKLERLQGMAVIRKGLELRLLISSELGLPNSNNLDCFWCFVRNGSE